MLRLLVVFALAQYVAADTFFLYGGETTYIQVTDILRYADAADYCKTHFNGQLAAMASTSQLRKANQILAQGFGLEGFFEEREWSEMWVGGNTNTSENDLVDPDSVGSGSSVLVLSSWEEERCHHAYCLYAKPTHDLPRRFLCESRSMKFSMAIASHSDL